MADGIGQVRMPPTREDPLGQRPPTASDPLGQRPDPTSFFDAITKVVDERIEARLRGRTLKELDGVADMILVHELIARGWAVYRPQSKD